jgi:hypothetical protein
MSPIKKLIIIILLSALYCSFFNSFIQKGLRKYSLHTNSRLSELFNNKTPYDIIFIGSSRTHVGINPIIIDSTCKTSSYNFGIEGGNLLEFYYVFKAYFENHPPPRNLILTLDFYSFNLTRKFFNHTIYLNYTNNAVVKKMLNENGHNTTLFKLMPFLFLTEQDDYSKGNAFKGYEGITDIPNGDSTYKGFETNSENVLNENSIVNNKPPYKAEIDTLGLDYLNKIIALCKEKNVKLIFTYAPEFNFKLQRPCINAKAIFDMINGIARTNNIPYLRGDSLEICKNPRLFADIAHLNKPGANAYSMILAKQLKTIIKK